MVLTFNPNGAGDCNLADTKTLKMTETLAYGYSYDSTQQELSNEYQHDRVGMVLKIKNLCILVLWTKVASALEGSKADKICQRLFPHTALEGSRGSVEIVEHAG